MICSDRKLAEAIRLGFAPDPTPLCFDSPEELAATFVERYRHRFDLFAIEQCGIRLDEWQESVGHDVFVDGERLISIRSCHNVGKSTVLALIALCFLLTRYRCKVVMTAPSAGQLFDALFAETKSLLRRMPEAIQAAFEVKSDRIELKAAPEDVFLTVRTSSKERPEALQGIHSDNVLLIADEASGVPDEVFNAAGGPLAGENCILIMTGNPTRLLGRFAKSHNDRVLRNSYKRYHIGRTPADIIDDGTIHFTSNRITEKYANDVRAEHGEESDEYRIRVLGEFPKGDGDSYIPHDLVVAAMQRVIAVPAGARPIWAVDPSRFGNDATALAERTGPVVTSIERKKGLDTMTLCGWIKSKYDALPESKRPTEILVDVIGLGAGIYDRLNELQLPVRSVNVTEATTMQGVGAMRLRDELWMRLKKHLQKLNYSLPESDVLLEDLTRPRYSYSSDGRLKIESKQEMRSRGEPSPDVGDAVVMLELVEDYAMFSDASGNRSWNKPLQRGLKATV